MIANAVGLTPRATRLLGRECLGMRNPAAADTTCIISTHRRRRHSRPTKQRSQLGCLCRHLLSCPHHPLVVVKGFAQPAREAWGMGHGPGMTGCPRGGVLMMTLPPQGSLKPTFAGGPQPRPAHRIRRRCLQSRRPCGAGSVCVRAAPATGPDRARGFHCALSPKAQSARHTRYQAPAQGSGPPTVWPA